MPPGNDIINLLRYVRIDVGDDGSTQTYTDTQLITMVNKATIRVDYDIGFGLQLPTSGGYVAFVQTLTGSTFSASGTFTLPTGASTSGLPQELFNLVTLKTECLLAKRAHFDAAGKAIRVKDGDSEIDTSVGFGGLRDLTSGEGGPCAEYEKALTLYLKWLQTELGNDITNYAAIVWKGSHKKVAEHVEAGVGGEIKVEILADFSDYLRSDGSTGDGTSRVGPDVSI